MQFVLQEAFRARKAYCGYLIWPISLQRSLNSPHRISCSWEREYLKKVFHCDQRCLKAFWQCRQSFLSGQQQNGLWEEKGWKGPGDFRRWGWGSMTGQEDSSKASVRSVSFWTPLVSNSLGKIMEDWREDMEAIKVIFLAGVWFRRRSQGKVVWGRSFSHRWRTKVMVSRDGMEEGKLLCEVQVGGQEGFERCGKFEGTVIWGRDLSASPLTQSDPFPSGFALKPPHFGGVWSPSCAWHSSWPLWVRNPSLFYSSYLSYHASGD